MDKLRSSPLLRFWSLVPGPWSLVLLLGFCILAFGFSAEAAPRKGFYEGPYLTLSGGLMRFNWDENQRTHFQEGNIWEPMIHLGFGWNAVDWFAPELNLRFGTDRNGERREYMAGANLGFNFTWLFHPLLRFEKWKILPFVKPGFVFQAFSLPGDPTATDHRVTAVGFGGGVGGGVRFLFKEYLYMGVEVEQDWINHRSKYQLLTSGSNALIYEGGFKRQFETLLMVGVHF